MYRQTSHSLLRSAQTTFRHAQPSSRRFLNTAPPHKTSRSWKSSAVRWGIAGAGIYYYNTSPIFAENTKRVMKFESPLSEEFDTPIPTVDQYAAEKKQEQKAAAGPLPPTSESVATDDPSALEEEADSQGAFNPVTGEINWDCPCLGGMAHGPCGEDFRAAFSCFVYSEQEPKGLDCIDKFKSMQDCFRSHPEVYAAELEDDEAELDAELAREREGLQGAAAGTPSSSGLNPEMPEKRILDDEPSTSLPYSPILSADAPPSRREPASSPSPQTSKQQNPSQPPSESQPHREATTSATQTPPKASPAASSSKKFDEDLELMPKSWHDGTDPSEQSVGEKKSK